MSHRVQRLFPPPHETVELRGLYLSLNLHRLGTPEQPFVYANFLSSLDGRIALEDAKGVAHLPKSLTTPADFRLFLELQAQADCLITHGGYLRALAAGRLGNILQVGQREDAADLAQWRTAQGLPPQPAIVVASASLDFPMPDCIRQHGQTCLIATGQQADPAAVTAWTQRGYEVIFAGTGRRVEGGALARALGDKGLRCLYLIAGPEMLDTMLRDGQLGRLFQTITHQLLGGLAFRTVSPGPTFGALGHLRLRGLHYDPDAPAGAGQWFAQFECGAAKPSPSSAAADIPTNNGVST
ncbi:MAG: RibD family protein [Candidatus Methylumidiphilus sp.]